MKNMEATYLHSLPYLIAKNEWFLDRNISNKEKQNIQFLINSRLYHGAVLDILKEWLLEIVLTEKEKNSINSFINWRCWNENICRMDKGRLNALKVHFVDRENIDIEEGETYIENEEFLEKLWFPYPRYYLENRGQIWLTGKMNSQEKENITFLVKLDFTSWSDIIDYLASRKDPNAKFSNQEKKNLAYLKKKGLELDFLQKRENSDVKITRAEQNNMNFLKYYGFRDLAWEDVQKTAFTQFQKENIKYLRVLWFSGLAMESFILKWFNRKLSVTEKNNIQYLKRQEIDWKSILEVLVWWWFKKKITKQEKSNIELLKWNINMDIISSIIVWWEI